MSHALHSQMTPSQRAFAALTSRALPVKPIADREDDAQKAIRKARHADRKQRRKELAKVPIQSGAGTIGMGHRPF